MLPDAQLPSTRPVTGTASPASYSRAAPPRMFTSGRPRLRTVPLTAFVAKAVVGVGDGVRRGVAESVAAGERGEAAGEALRSTR